MKNKIAVVMLMVMVLVSITSVPVKAQTYGSMTKENQIKLVDDIANDKKFTEEINKYMIQQYGKNYEEKLANNQNAVKSAHKIENTFQKNKKGNYIYPNYVGGLYINNDDRLVIQLVEGSIPTMENKEYINYKNIIEMDNNAKVEFVNYSYEELTKIHDIILNDFLGKDNNVVGLYTDVIKNKVVVEVKNRDMVKLEKMKENGINIDMVVFEKGGSFSEVANINPGGKFFGTAGYCSYGYRAKTGQGKIGIVTAGHCFTNNEESISGIGTVTKRRNDGTLDAAFVQTNSGVTPTNTLDQKPAFGTYNTISTTVTSSYVTGQSIAKLGYRTGYTMGNVVSGNYSYTDQGVTYTDLVRASLAVEQGDSGGIVIETRLTFPNTSYTTAGIVKSKGNGSFSGQALITKASKINSIFGISRY